MNKTMYIGNLTRDPQLRTVNTVNGQMSVCNFDIAVNDRFGGTQSTTYVRISAWGAAAENHMKYIKKGSKVYVEGVVRPNSYQGSDGQTHLTLELNANHVEYLSSNGGTAASAPTGTARAAAPATNYDAPVEESRGFDISTDELPF